jgi:hypothetical protein
MEPVRIMTAMDDYLCITVLSRPGEGKPDFAARLSQFWTHMLRSHKDDFQKVYAETTAYGTQGESMTRQYLVEADVADLLEREFAAAAIGHGPIDRDDTYSKFEATPPDWMWIEH